jgi:hypothetical protein
MSQHIYHDNVPRCNYVFNVQCTVLLCSSILYVWLQDFGKISIAILHAKLLTLHCELHSFEILESPTGLVIQRFRPDSRKARQYAAELSSSLVNVTRNLLRGRAFCSYLNRVDCLEDRGHPNLESKSQPQVRHSNVISSR